MCYVMVRVIVKVIRYIMVRVVKAMCLLRSGAGITGY